MAIKKKQQDTPIPQSETKFSDMVKKLQKTDGHSGARLVKDIGQVPFWLSTGDDILDIYISNRKHGGVAGGRITQFNGLPQCVTEDTLINVKIK